MVWNYKVFGWLFGRVLLFIGYWVILLFELIFRGINLFDVVIFVVLVLLSKLLLVLCKKVMWCGYFCSFGLVGWVVVFDKILIIVFFIEFDVFEFVFVLFLNVLLLLLFIIIF